MLQNVDSLLSILVSVLTLIGFLFVLLRRPPKNDVAMVSQASLPAGSAARPKKRKSGFSTILLLLLVAGAGFAAWRFIAVPFDTARERTIRDHRTTPTFNRDRFDRTRSPDRDFRR